MAHVPGRKYEVTLPDGRVVSRQRAYDIRNSDRVRLSKNAYLREYFKSNPEKAAAQRERNRLWRERYEAEHGESYSAYKWRKKKENENQVK